MNWFTLYLLTLIPSIGSMACGIALFTAFGSALLMVLFIVAHERHAMSDENAASWRARCLYLWRRAAVVFAISTTITTITPSKQDLMFIVGGSVLIDVASSDRAKGIADQSLKVVEKWLADQTKETSK